MPHVSWKCSVQEEICKNIPVLCIAFTTDILLHLKAAVLTILRCQLLLWLRILIVVSCLILKFLSLYVQSNTSSCLSTLIFCSTHTSFTCVSCPSIFQSLSLSRLCVHFCYSVASSFHIPTLFMLLKFFPIFRLFVLAGFQSRFEPPSDFGL